MSALSQNVREYQLDNGLKVLLKEVHTAPLTSIWVWYRFGSRDEAAGQTGSAHWIEHMQFKGTPRFPGDELDRLISREGGVWNAFTYLDWTAYFATLPADQADLILDLESDRMVNSRFDPDDLLSERTVILSELEGAQNDPYSRLKDAVQAEMFSAHPYGHPVIGYREDLLAMTRADLYAQYQAHYRPDNAVLVLAGDFKHDAMLSRVGDFFGKLAAGAAPRRSLPAEPPRQAEGRIVMSGPDETPFLQVAYRAPAVTHPDTYALHLLDSFLTGPAGIGVFGGSLSNKSSWLYRKLVSGGQAVAVHGGLHATLDPFMYTLSLTLPPGGQPEKVLQDLDQALDAILQDGLRAEDLQRARKQAQALFAYGAETVTQQASWLGYYEMFARWNWFESYLSRLDAVTPDDILRVARHRLRPENRVVGIYQPERSA